MPSGLILSLYSKSDWNCPDCLLSLSVTLSENSALLFERPNQIPKATFENKYPGRCEQGLRPHTRQQLGTRKVGKTGGLV